MCECFLHFLDIKSIFLGTCTCEISFTAAEASAGHVRDECRTVPTTSTAEAGVAGISRPSTWCGASRLV
jgi:hypothetical protein